MTRDHEALVLSVIHTNLVNNLAAPDLRKRELIASISEIRKLLKEENEFVAQAQKKL